MADEPKNKKPVDEKPADKKPEDKSAEPAPADDKTPPPAPAPEKKEVDSADPATHPDVEQDIALIKKYLDEYLGAGAYGDEEADMAKEAGAYFSGKGDSKDAAYKKAAEYLGFAKSMAKKQSEVEAAEAEAAKPKEEEAKEAAEKKENEVKEAAEKKAKEDESKKECAECAATKEANIKLTTDVATLKEALKKKELDEHIEKSLRESKLPMALTKSFKESEAFKTIKNQADFDKAFSILVEARKLNLGSKSGVLSGVQLGTEKQVSPADGKKVLDLSGCKY